MHPRIKSIQSAVTCITARARRPSFPPCRRLSVASPGSRSRLLTACMSITLRPSPLHPPHGSMPHSDPSRAACPWIKGENYTEMSLKTCSSTPTQSQPSVIFYLALFGAVVSLSFSFPFFSSPPPTSPLCCFCNTTQSKFKCVPLVTLFHLSRFFFPLEVGGSRLNRSHVPEELQKNVHIGRPSTFYSDSKLREGGGIFQGHAKQHSHSCMVIKCKRLPIGLWQRRRQRFPSHSQIFSPRF